MKLGINMGYWGSGPPAGVAESLAAAEAAGFDSAWTAEAYGSDALTPLAWYGAQTKSLRLGTAIMQMSARTPAATAMAAMTLDHLSGGRVILGIGASGPQVVEGWYGQPYPRPLERTREYVDIMRKIMARDEPVEFHGKHYDMPYQRRHGSRQAAEVDNSPVAHRYPRSSSPPRARRTSRSPPKSPMAGCRSSSRRRATSSTARRSMKAFVSRARAAPPPTSR